MFRHSLPMTVPPTHSPLAAVVGSAHLVGLPLPGVFVPRSLSTVAEVGKDGNPPQPVS